MSAARPPLAAPAVSIRPSWFLPEREATPEAAFLNRRSLLKSLGLAGAGLALGSGLIPGPAEAAESAADKTAGLYPARHNDAFVLDRDITPEAINGTYNNFYEFGSHKQIYRDAERLVTDPWAITIDGLVDRPETIEFAELAKAMALEERLYRHRCVEAWSMTIPWTGFTLAKLLERAGVKPDAKYVRFETFLDPVMATGQRQVWYPWPYVEGVTIAEARNDLAFLVTGAYGKPLANQFGAPLRLALPWKYGFKSIKSITRISLVAERPVSFWEAISKTEYGFWANVNPEVPHPRWSQATEKVLHTGEERETRLFNGYGEQVAGLYSGLDAEPLYR